MPKPIWLEVECPFYNRSDSFHIFCESELGVKASTGFTFKKYKDRKEHFEKYCCCDGGRKCLHYRYVASLYERGVLS